MPLPAPPTAAVVVQRPSSCLPPAPQVLLVSAAAAWLIFCTWMFHGVLEVQMTVGSSVEVSDLPPTERSCDSYLLLHWWCEQRVAWYRAQAVRHGMMHAWAGYKAFAWGADEIHPKSKTAKTDIMVRALPRVGGGCRNRLQNTEGRQHHGGSQTCSPAT